MGFSCCACRKPFEGIPPSEKGGGDYRDQAAEQPVSAIVKCGHLFHTDCLQKNFQSQSGNAWIPKSCPACGNVVTAHDVIRVHACPIDARSTQRPRIEEVMLEKKKLMDNYECLHKRFEMLRVQIGEKNADIETIKRQKDELGLRLDQVCRLNSIHKADIERYKTEIDKLKNIIITLTGKLTGITGNDYTINELYGPAPGSNNGMNVNCRLEYTDELQRMAVYDATATLSHSIVNGSLEKSTHHHPPGFMYRMPFPLENGSDGQDSDRGSQALGGSPEIQKIFENATAPIPVPGNEVIIIPSGNNPQHMRFFATDVQVGNYDYDTNNNNNSGFGKKIDDPFTKQSSNDFISKENAPLSVGGKYPSITAPKLVTEKKEAYPMSSSKKVDKMGIDFGEVDDAVGKWHEKKSRRRNSSKSSGTTGPRERNSGKYDHLSDKKLLYGSFSCPTCNAKWGSSQSVLNTPQTCRICKTEVHPHEQGPILSRRALEMSKQVSNNASSKVSVKERKKL